MTECTIWMWITGGGTSLLHVKKICPSARVFRVAAMQWHCPRRSCQCSCLMVKQLCGISSSRTSEHSPESLAFFQHMQFVGKPEGPSCCWHGVVEHEQHFGTGSDCSRVGAGASTQQKLWDIEFNDCNPDVALGLLVFAVRPMSSGGDWMT